MLTQITGITELQKIQRNRILIAWDIDWYISLELYLLNMRKWKFHDISQVTRLTQNYASHLFANIVRSALKMIIRCSETNWWQTIVCQNWQKCLLLKQDRGIFPIFLDLLFNNYQNSLNSSSGQAQISKN